MGYYVRFYRVVDDVVDGFDETARTEVEPVYAGPQVRTIRFDAVYRKHADSMEVVVFPGYAGQVSYVSACGGT